MPAHDIIVVGASAGGVETLNRLVQYLPSRLPAAIFVVLHLPSQGTSVLPSILNRALKKRHQDSSIKALHPRDGEAIEYGRIYIAPADQHLLVKEGYIRLTRGPKENSHRPAVDPLFRTAAQAYGARVIGIVLSGNLDDGTAGLLAVKQRGGVAIVQDPNEATYSGMPNSAIENVAVDHILRVTEIVPVLVELAHQPVEQEAVAVSNDMKMEVDIAELKLEAMQNSDRPGKPSPFGCPDCGGVLWELDEGDLTRFRCRTGHAYAAKSLLAKQSEAVEEALWKALRALEEKAVLGSRLAIRARERNQTISAQRFEQQAQDLQQRVLLIRQLLLINPGNEQLSTINGEVVGAQVAPLQVVTADALTETTAATVQPTTEHPEQVLAQLSTAENTGFKVVALCASAGGLNAISEVLSGLPADFPAAITVVQHLARQYRSYLPDILSRYTALKVKQAEEGEALLPGMVYIAPADQHLLVNLDQTLTLSHAQLVNFVRPSADLLFESVAATYKLRAIAVVLTGTGKDAAMGIRAIKQMGGTTIAQDQATSEYFGMPSAAIDTGNVDLVVPLNKIAATLVSLVKDEA